MDDSFVWDDRTWDRVWERTLTQVERHDIAMTVLRRREPPTAFERRIAVELAKRWRRHALFLAMLYLLWSTFWAALAWDSLQRYGSATAATPLVCTTVGVAGIAACLAFRRRIREVTGAAPGDPVAPARR